MAFGAPKQSGESGDSGQERRFERSVERNGSSSYIGRMTKVVALAVGMALSSCGGVDQPVDNGRAGGEVTPARLSEALTRMGVDKANGALNVHGYLEKANPGQRLIVPVDVEVTLDNGKVIRVKKDVTVTAEGVTKFVNVPLIEEGHEQAKTIKGTIGAGQAIDVSF